MNTLIKDIAPPSGLVGHGLFVVQLLAIATVYSIETKQPAEYSKFASKDSNSQRNKSSADDDKSNSSIVPSRQGMLIIYVPATVVSVLFLAVPQFHHSKVSVFVFLHFLKRVLEVLFLHKYSGGFPKEKAVEIGTFYAVMATVICSYAVPIGRNAPGFLYTGYALFVVGQIGNFYHHYLLALLRTEGANKAKEEDGSTKKYLPPRGGLFSVVAAPHYLFEVIAWAGMACIAQQANAFAVLGTTVMYLSARAKNQHMWNAQKFSKQQWDPETKWNIFPLVF